MAGNTVATYCTNLMKIGSVTPVITRVTTAPFWTRLQKSANLTKYLSTYWADLQQIFSVGRHMYVIYYIHINCVFFNYILVSSLIFFVLLVYISNCFVVTKLNKQIIN